MTVSDLQVWCTFAFVGAAIISYALERVPLEVTSIATVVTVLVFFHFVPVPGAGGENLLDAERILSGFASPALASIMALMVIGQGLYQTGALDTPAAALMRLGTRTPVVSIGATFLVAGLVSAFMNNTPVVVMFIPIVMALAARMRTSPSRLVMPVSFITVLGGMTTLVGSSTNLLVAGVAADVGGPRIDFFDPLVPGVILAGVGALYVMLVMPRLLDRRETMAQEVTGAAGRHFIAEIEIQDGHVLNGATARAGLFPDLKDMTVRLIQRGERAILPPFEDVTLRPGDVVVVAATRQTLTEALTRRQPILTTSGSGDGGEADGPDLKEDLVLAEAVIAPASRLIGRSLEQAHLRAETGTIVLGVQRRSRMIRSGIGTIRLEAGDVILILGTSEDMGQLRANRDVLLLEWSQADLPRTRFAIRAIAILAATLTTAAFGLMPIAHAAMIGALAMIVVGCLNVRQAARAFDRRVYLLIGASLALAAPLDATGGAALVAGVVVDLASDAGPGATLAALFLLIAIFTNLLSNHATAALFTPVAVAAAARMGVDPMPFVLTVIYAANCSFATPIAYQTNLLVLGPGRYRFVDFIRAGTPLILIVWLVYCVVAPWYFGL